MKITTLRDGFVSINAEEKELGSLQISELKKYKAVILRNLKPFKTQDYVEFAKKFGPILPYGNGPIFAFDGTALDEVELHPDGISANHPKKFPHWLVFHVRKSNPPELGGQFKVADAEAAFSKLSENTKNFLRTTKLQFFGYYDEQRAQKKFDEFSFEISPVANVDGRESLRVFLPSLDDRTYVDSKKCFSGKTFEETLQIFQELKKVLYMPENICRFAFEDNDLLVLNNSLTFHGREKFSQPVFRSLDRIQALAEDAIEFGLK